MIVTNIKELSQFWKCMQDAPDFPDLKDIFRIWHFLFGLPDYNECIPKKEVPNLENTF